MERNELLARFAAKIPVLDHGFVRHIESWGHGDAGEPEAGIIEAARQSTQGSFRGWDQDEKLLRFLFSNKPPHATPFEFAGMVIEVRAPIFVFREWHRHRTQSYNEMSARYAPLPDENYVPAVERIMMGAQATANKQAGTAKDAMVINKHNANVFRNMIIGDYERLQLDYETALKMGVPKELARVILPVGRYSQMRASTSLRNWLAFLTLRMDPGAQWEIRQFAHAVGQIIATEFPRTWALFCQNQAVPVVREPHAAALSAKAVAALRQILEKSGVSPQLSPESLAAHRDFVALDKADREALLRLLDVEAAR